MKFVKNWLHHKVEILFCMEGGETSLHVGVLEAIDFDFVYISDETSLSAYSIHAIKRIVVSHSGALKELLREE